MEQIQQIDKTKLPLLIQACVTEVQRISQVIAEGKSRYNQYQIAKQQFDEQRTDYWSKVNLIEARKSSGQINHYQKLYEIALLNKNYPVKVYTTGRYDPFPDLPPLFTAWANISCFNCNNTFATNNLDEAEVKLNQAINCVLNKIQQEYPEALHGGTANGGGGTTDGTNNGPGDGNDDSNADGTDGTGMSDQMKYFLIGGVVLIFIVLMMAAVGVVVIV